MKKGLIISAALLVLVGLALFAGAFAASGFDFSKLDVSKYETNTYDISESFHNISLDTDTADIVFAPSGDGKCRAVFYEKEKMRHTAEVRDGTLMISVTDTEKWYDHIVSFSVKSSKITIYLPQSEYMSLSIKEDTGDIEIPKDFKFESIDISASTGDIACCASASGDFRIEVSTGDVRLENTSVGELDISTSTGEVYLSSVACAGSVGVTVSTGRATLKDVIVAGRISIASDTGDLKFDGCDAAELFIETDTGDVDGTLLSEKVFITQSDTGRIDVPKTVTGGRCEITTDTGDIRIGLVEK